MVAPLPPIPIFIGYDPRLRAAVNVLIDSLVQHSSRPLAITPIVARQMGPALWRRRGQDESTEFSISRFLVPYLMGYQGWALFMDGDMLARDDINELWDLRDDRHAVMVVQHDHRPSSPLKFGGARQSAYPRKNWSSLILFNCARCQALTPAYVNTASGLALHGFEWLAGEEEAIGALPGERWNHLVDVQPEPQCRADRGGPALLHWTLGGPWFRDSRTAGGPLAAEWFAARDGAFRLWE